MAEFLTPGVIGGGLSLLGAGAGLLGGGGGSRPTTQNQSSSYNNTQTNTPWSGVSPYFMGGTDGTPGIWPSAAANYTAGAWSPTQQDTAMNWFNDTSNSRNIARDNGFQNIGSNLANGNYDPSITRAGPIAGAPTIGPNAFTPSQARSNQGSLDPTTALQGILSGTQSSPWIGDQQKAITDSMTRNFNEQVLPGIRQTAIADGQYGGSRGDLANTLAVSRLNTDLAPALTGLATSAHEADLQRQYGAATGLNQQATDVANANANRAMSADTLNASNLLDTQKFNTGTTLNNNSQAMQDSALRVNNAGAGLNFAQGANGLLNTDYSTMLTALGLPNTYNTQQLQNYAGLLNPALGFQTTTGSGTSQSQGSSMQPTYSNPAAGALGGALGGYALYNGLFGNGSGGIKNFVPTQTNYSGFLPGQGPVGPSGAW